MLKRIGLFILANLAIFVMLSVILTVVQMATGIDFGTMTGMNLNFGALFVFSMVVGFSSALISLFMSKTIAKQTMGLQMVDVTHPQTPLEQYLVQVVHAQTQRAGLPMPEIGVYEGDPNAFATGWSRNHSLIAVSTGLLQLMNRDEVEAVIAHELSHVKNGDMVTMTLLQGVMNTFVIFFARIIGWVVDRQVLRNEDEAPGAGYYITSLVLQIVFGLLASLVVAAFSRYREFRADAGAAHIMGSNQPMMSALMRLGNITPEELPAPVHGLGIAGGIGSLLASHPPIQARIEALRTNRYSD